MEQVGIKSTGVSTRLSKKDNKEARRSMPELLDDISRQRPGAITVPFHQKVLPVLLLLQQMWHDRLNERPFVAHPMCNESAVLPRLSYNHP